MADEQKTRHAIMDLLKRGGPLAAGTLAETLGLSAMAIRLHLYGLRDRGLVAAEEEARPIGRPVKLWRLTEGANAYFPDGHADLTQDLLTGMRAAFGDEGLERIVAVRAERQVAAYRTALNGTASLEERVALLAEKRTAEGYMAHVEPAADGTGWLLIENHCPICAAARACSGLCKSELSVFRAALGDAATVERTDHILAGARRCAYRVTPCPPPNKS